MSEVKKGELAIRDKAILHQQRRLKQATQFTHKDSADLLPLDGLKRLGTSKDLVSGAQCVCGGSGLLQSTSKLGTYATADCKQSTLIVHE